MNEISEIPKLPIPISNYLHLIKERTPPYYDIVQHLLREMELHYQRSGASEIVYTINPRRLQEEIEEKVKSEKLTTVNICRTVLAFLYGSKLRKEKDFYTTTTTGGRKNYHVKINQNTFNVLSKML